MPGKRGGAAGAGGGRRGFTLCELMVAVGVYSLIILTMATVQYVSTRMSKEISGQARARSARMISLDQVRYHLMNARVNTCAVSQSAHRIDYVDPTQAGTPTSALYFSTVTNQLYYDKDTNDSYPAVAVGRGANNITFTVPNAALVTVTANTSSTMGRGMINNQTLATSIYLRNP